MTLRIDQQPFLVTVDVVVVALALYLLVRPSPRRVLIGLAAAIAGGAAGWFATWLVADRLDLFGVPLTTVSRAWVIVGCAGVGLALANVFRARWWRTVIALLSIPVFVMASAAGINVDFGAYRTLDDAVGVVPYRGLDLHHEHGETAAIGTDYAATWTPPASIPSKGELGTVRIPATTSRFPARTAVVYLPPAALTPSPPVLPVVYAFAGQPGAPADVFTAGRLNAVMDAFAARHGGLAPIVVAADQLGGPDRNPMCVDSTALGRSATYLLGDVRTWVRDHLRVSSDPAAWSVFGYSQGATCAVQFAAGHPELFGSALASSSELGPTLGAGGATVAKGFGGSLAAYRAAQPSALLRAHAPYRHSLIVFGTGANDQRYTGYARTLQAEAQRAGVASTLLVAPGSAHDWHTVRYTWAHGFAAIAAHLGLPR